MHTKVWSPFHVCHFELLLDSIFLIKKLLRIIQATDAFVDFGMLFSAALSQSSARTYQVNVWFRSDECYLQKWN